MELVEIRNVSPVKQSVPGRGEAKPGGTLKVSPSEADSLEQTEAWERETPVHQKPGSSPEAEADGLDQED